MDYDPFKGRLVRLRAREPEDAERVHRWLNQPALAQLLDIPYPRSLPRVRESIEDGPPAAYAAARFAIEDIDGKHIGNCALHSLAPETRAARISIWIGEEEYWGNGYGTDAAKLLCRFGFDMMNLHRIEADVPEDNARANRCFEKVGFQREGSRREAHFSRGRHTNVLVLGLLRGELKPS